jgi:hypothetical protein
MFEIYMFEFTADLLFDYSLYIYILLFDYSLYIYIYIYIYRLKQ